MDMAIDASIIIAIITNEATKSTLIAATSGTDLVAPVSVHFEIGNAFSAMLKRKRITLNQIYDALAHYQEIPIRYVDIDLQDSIAIASQLGIYAYDAYLIRCAERYRCPLLTLDEALQAHARGYGVQLVKIKS